MTAEPIPDPAEVLANCEAQAEQRDAKGAGLRIWRAAVQACAARLRLDARVIARGAAHAGANFARVEPRPGGRFVLAEPAIGAAVSGVPALVWPLANLDGWGLDDLLALDLRPVGEGMAGRRFWRLTGKRAAELADGAAGEPAARTLRLRQDAHAWARSMLLWHATSAEAEDAGRAAYAAAIPPAGWSSTLKLPVDHPERVSVRDAVARAHAAQERAFAAHFERHPFHAPGGVLVLDPAAIDWTKRGALAGVETIEILDAPAGGELGRALCKLNPRIGGRTGVGLYGTATAETKGRAA